MNDRMQAYLNGELSLEEARELEAELARQGAEMDPAVIEDKSVGDAWRALDARERVPKRSARRVPVAVWFALAAGLALAIWFAWPRPEPVQIAEPKLPPVVIPVPQVADQEVVEGNDVVQVATPEVVASDVQLAAVDTEVAPPKVAVGADGVFAVNGQALVIDLKKTTLGIGPEARVAADASAKRPTRFESLRIEAHPQMEALVTSGLLDHIVHCIDEGRAERGTFQVSVLSAWVKTTRYLRVTGARAATQAACIQTYEPYATPPGNRAWEYDEGRQLGSDGAFEMTLSRANTVPEPKVEKSPGKKTPEPDKEPNGKTPSKGKVPWKGKLAPRNDKVDPYDGEPTKGGKGNPYDSD